MFKLEAITKSFGPQLVLNGLTLSLAPGQLTLLLGSNGAGKSTLLRICAGLTRPDSGEICWDGQEQRSRVPMRGHAGHAPALYSQLTVFENLQLLRELMGLGTDPRAYLAEWRLSEYAGTRLGALSKGLQHRVSLCRALMHAPRYLFLDEPTSNLDEDSCAMLVQRLKRHLSEVPDSLVLLATHDVARLRAHADRLVVLEMGGIRADSAREGEGAKSAAVEFYHSHNH